MKCNMFTTSEATLLAFVAAQFASAVLAVPLADLALNNISKRQCSPSLGVAETFALLSIKGITNSGNPPTITGNIGAKASGVVINGIVSGDVSGTIESGNAAATSAAAAASSACACALSDSPATTKTGALGGVTFTAGTYSITGAASAAANTVITLDGANNANSVFIFQIGAALTVAANVSVNLINGAKACNVYWVVGAATTLGAGTNFKGNICASAAITSGINVVANGSWLVLPTTAIITIDGGTFTADTTC